MKFFLGLFFLLLSSLYSDVVSGPIFISVMKSGSGLGVKTMMTIDESLVHRLNFIYLIQGMNDQERTVVINNFRLDDDKYPNTLPSCHSWDCILDLFLRLDNMGPPIPLILNIRDPRDTCLSYITFCDGKNREALLRWKHVPNYWNDLTFDEKLSYAIRESSIKTQFRNILDLSSLPNTLLIRFENLVGSFGQGSDALQRAEVVKMSEFMNISHSNEKISLITREIFGDSGTFRTGQIGDYKNRFKLHHHKEFMEAFKDVLEPLSEWYDFSDSAQICHEGE